MAKQSRNSGRSSRRSGGNGIGKFILGMLLGAALTLLTIAAWMRFGKPPVAVSDAASLWEPLVASVPANARAKAEAKTPPFPASEDTFEAAAKLYRQQCASCHGAPGQSSATGRAMSPRAPQFFSPQDKSVLASQKPGEIYWKTAYGIRRTGMPAFGKTFTDTQLWQISLLLQASNSELPDPVRNLLTEGLPPLQPTEIKP
ncbi:cytochrome c [Terriglobus sp. TAA 43]|uniref:c-type cytochrome n=1 Tax=Terriglobus sp. TAA 43 TaxID=278961 RepID=UPI00068929D8|nr:cytochrome c [Terriglobus sp. TAA 43]